MKLVSDFFWNPRRALKQIADEMPGNAALLLFGVYLLLKAGLAKFPTEATSYLHKLPESFYWLQKPLIWKAMSIAWPLYAVVQTAVCIHLFALLLGGTSTLRRWSKVVLVVWSVVGLFQTGLSQSVFLVIILSIWKIMLIWTAASAVYSFSPIRAVFSSFCSWFIHGLLVLIGVVGVILVAALKPGELTRFLHPPVIERPAIKTPVPYDWSLKSLDGRSVSLNEFKGKVVVLNFWATWCAPCLAEMPSLDALYEQVKDEGIVVLGVSDENPEKVRLLASARKFHFPIYVVDSQRPSVLATSSIPATFILSKEGFIVSKHIGSARWDSPAVVQLLRELNGPAPKDAAKQLHEAGLRAVKDQQWTAARDQFQKAIRVGEQDLGPLDEQVAQSYRELGTTYFQLKDYPKALAAHQQALAIYGRLPSARTTEVVELLKMLSREYMLLGQKEQAIIAEQRATAMVAPPIKS